jgi:TAG lipase / steryl ester hydrolase / phospholipase A2 / LPA acyltransferase
VGWLRTDLRDVYAALDSAASYAEWLAAAEEHDRLTGADRWRQDDESPHYDAPALRASQQRLAALRAAGDGPGLAAELTADLYRHLGDLTSPDLYGVALAGTKHLVGQYLDQVEASMRWLASHPIPGMPRSEVVRRFKDASRVYGRSALLLSGGATLGFHHLGVVKALFELGLLPHVLSGASTGAMIAAGVGSRTDAEIRAMFGNLDSLRLDGLKLAPLGAIARARAALDPEQLYAVLKHNVGDLTFAEAFARSGRELAISVSPTRARQKPRLLAWLTAPEALVARAALASSALPGLFPPIQLSARAPDGREVPYLPEERWVDGSIHGDVPMRRLSRLFNANHFVVSQTNPHVLPFVRHHGRRGIVPLVFGVVSTTVRGQGQWATDVGRRVVPERAGGRTVQQLHALFSQDYGGDVQIHPQFHWTLYRKIVSNPTRADLAAFVREGERSVWPRVALVRDQTRVGRVFREVVAALE